MTAESLLDPRLAPRGALDLRSPEAGAQQEPFPLLQQHLLGEGGDWNLSPRDLEQQLGGLERGSLEELAQELFVALKLSEGSLAAARHATARRTLGPSGGAVGTAPSRLATSASDTTLGLRRPHAATGTHQSAATVHSGHSPAGTHRQTASAPGVKKPIPGSGFGGSQRFRSGTTNTGSGSICSTRGSPAASTACAGDVYCGELDAEVHSSATLRSPRQAVSEAERQQIFERLYNSAREQRVRRHTLAELKKLQTEVRFVEECPFEPRLGSQRRRKSPSTHA